MSPTREVSGEAPAAKYFSAVCAGLHADLEHGENAGRIYQSTDPHTDMQGAVYTDLILRTLRISGTILWSCVSVYGSAELSYRIC